MPEFYRYRVDLGAFGDGSPGVNILHSTVGAADNPSDIGNFMNQIRNGFDQVKGLLVSGMTVNVNQEVTKHDVETGKLLAVFVVPAPAQVTGSGTGTATNRATQVVCRHNTDKITSLGKRLVGRTYVGPVASGAIDNNGHITTAAQNLFNQMWNGMQDVAGTLRLIVWGRPHWPEGLGPPDPPSIVGTFGHSISTVTLAKPGVLRGRRD